MRRLRAFVLALVFVVATTGGAAAAPSQPPDEFVRTLGKTAIISLGGTDITEPEREKRFRDLFNEYFDVPSIARFVLGRYWRRATEAQRQEYTRLFEDFIVKAYAKRFSNYSGDGFKTGNTTKVSGTDAVVSSQIKSSANAPPARVDWRVRTNDAHYKIVDVMVEGISMGVTHRDEFAAVIQDNGGTVAGLIAALKKKTQ